MRASWVCMADQQRRLQLLWGVALLQCNCRGRHHRIMHARSFHVDSYFKHADWLLLSTPRLSSYGSYLLLLPLPYSRHRYACGTLQHASKLTNKNIDNHEPGGRMLCVYTMCVSAAHRRQGVATR